MSGETNAPRRVRVGAERIRVLFVDHADFLGGAEQSELELLRLIDGTRFDLALACSEGALADAARAQGTWVISIDLQQVRGAKNALRTPFRLVRGVRALVRIIRRERVQILHSNTMRASIYAAPAAKLSGAQFVWHVHDLYCERLYVRALPVFADAILTNSRGALQRLPLGAQKKATVIYHGVQAAQFDPQAVDRQAIRDAWHVQPNELLVGNVGWLAPWKGQREFVEACTLIAQTCPDVRFVIVGAASDPRHETYASELKIFAAERLGDRLIWAGARPDVANVMAALDLLLHCAEREPFGRVLVEAMAMQVPVIAFGGGGPDEIIEDGQTGYLVEPHDVHALARAATSVLANEQCRQAMGRAGRARALALFAPERNVHLVEDVYVRLTAERQPAENLSKRP